MDFLGTHITSIDQFDRHAVETIFATAEQMLPFAKRQLITRVLEGAILSNLFFESSTRTRVSFGSAFNLLGGDVRETSNMLNSAMSKGESLQDTARVLSGYSDIICMRHPIAGSVVEFSKSSRVPVINGGDGDNEHPTQALLDLYTIKKELKLPVAEDLSSLSIAIVGDLRYGRTVHSLCKLLSLYRGIHLTLVSPTELAMPEEIVEMLKQGGNKVSIADDLLMGINKVNIVYSTRVQKERFNSEEEADLYRGRLRLNQQIYTKHCEPNTIIMHPLPRDSSQRANELDVDLDDNPNLAIFRQAENGVVVRMALFAMVLGVESSIHQTARPVHWYSKR